MVKSELAAKVADKLGLSVKNATEAIECVLDTIKETVDGNEEVTIRGFGTFKNKTYKARKARNIALGTIIEIPERIVPVFKPSKNF